MSNVSSLVKKTNNDTKVGELEKKITIMANCQVMLNCQVVTETLPKINQNTYLLRISWES